MTHERTDSRRFLLNTMRGTTDIAYMWFAEIFVIIADGSYFTTPPSCNLAMPCEPDALRSIYGLKTPTHEQPQHVFDTEATDAGRVQYIMTWRHYFDDNTDSEIAEAMAKYPCLVNYGGTLRAVNVEAGGSDFAIILKDMQA